MVKPNNVYYTDEMMLFQGAGHNDVELYNQYLERLKQFVSVELVNWQLLHPTAVQQAVQTAAAAAAVVQPAAAAEVEEERPSSTVSSCTTSSVTEKLL